MEFIYANRITHLFGNLNLSGNGFNVDKLFFLVKITFEYFSNFFFETNS